MLKPNLSVKINLSPAQQESVKSVFFKWFINVCKVIIILVWLITVGALIYRFMLDPQITDLHDQIKFKEKIVEKQKDKEREYRSLQKRLADIKTTDEETRVKIDTINKILPQMKQDAFLINRFTLNKNTIALEAETASIFVIPAFVSDVKQIDNVESIRISNVNSQDNLNQFTMDINLKSSPAGNSQGATGQESQNTSATK